MNVDRRLQHAARDLREIAIDVPPLDELTGAANPPMRPVGRRQPRLAALAAPMLFVAGGLLTVGVMQQPDRSPTHSDIGGATTVGANETPAPDPPVDVPSLREELRLIRGLVEEATEPSVSDPPPADPVIASSGPS